MAQPSAASASSPAPAAAAATPAAAGTDAAAAAYQRALFENAWLRRGTRIVVLDVAPDACERLRRRIKGLPLPAAARGSADAAAAAARQAPSAGTPALGVVARDVAPEDNEVPVVVLARVTRDFAAQLYSADTADDGLTRLAQPADAAAAGRTFEGGLCHSFGREECVGLLPAALAEKWRVNRRGLPEVVVSEGDGAALAALAAAFLDGLAVRETLLTTQVGCTLTAAYQGCAGAPPQPLSPERLLRRANAGFVGALGRATASGPACALEFGGVTKHNEHSRVGSLGQLLHPATASPLGVTNSLLVVPKKMTRCIKYTVSVLDVGYDSAEPDRPTLRGMIVRLAIPAHYYLGEVRGGEVLAATEKRAVAALAPGAPARATRHLHAVRLDDSDPHSTVTHLIDTSAPGATWVALINAATSAGGDGEGWEGPGRPNCEVVQFDRRLFVRTKQDISMGSELFVAWAERGTVEEAGESGGEEEGDEREEVSFSDDRSRPSTPLPKRQRFEESQRVG